MIIKENPISSQYHQIYFTFSIGTVNKIFDDIIEEYGFTSKDQEKKSKLITKMVMEKIEEELIEAELERIDRVPISSRKYRYLTEVRRDRPLLVICQFCVLSPDIPIRFPKHVPTEVFQIPYKDSILEDFANTILMKNNEFTEVEVDRATPDCIVTYDLAYVQGDFKLSEVSNLTIDLNKQEEESILFINCQKDDIIKLDESDNVKVIAKVKKIHRNAVKKLTDEIVQRINFLNTKTVSEFKQKIVDIFTFSTSSMILINYLTEFALKAENIEFDDYVKNHFLDNELAPKKKKDLDTYLKEVTKELVKEYILMIINLTYMEVEPRFVNRINEEFEFDKIVFNNPVRVDSYQDYVGKRIYETRVLEYCIDNKIVSITFE